MAGYFSNSGEGTDANAARQFEREFADNPKSFGGPGGGFLGRLIGARQPSNRITSEPLPDRTPPPEPQGGGISSGPLITRVIQTAMRPPMPSPGQMGPAMNPMTGPVGGGQNPNAGPAGFSPMQAPEGTPGPNVNAYGMPPTPGMPPMPPPWSQGALPLQSGPPMRGTSVNTDPALAGIPPQFPPMRGTSVNTDPRLAGIPPQFGPRQLTPQQRQAMIAQAYATMNRQQQEQAQALFQRPPANYANGGYLRMMRGGYPADLMMGMPMRHDYARGSYVSPDGQGDGRSDHVDAKLSPGEFVVDAESVSMLGNGSNEAGARKLEQMRSGIRRQKGNALAKGKFSPDAKSPEAYMRGKTRGKS